MTSLYFRAYSLRTFTILKHYFSEQQYLRHEFIIITWSRHMDPLLTYKNVL